MTEPTKEQNDLREKIAEFECEFYPCNELKNRVVLCPDRACSCFYRIHLFLSLLDTPAGIAYLKSKGWLKLDKWIEETGSIVLSSSDDVDHFFNQHAKTRGYVKLDDDQSLPSFRSNFDGSAQTIRQQDLFKTGFRRIQKEYLNGH